MDQQNYEMPKKQMISRLQSIKESQPTRVNSLNDQGNIMVDKDVQIQLQLVDNEIGDQELANIFNVIEQQRNLTQLSLCLSGNQITKDGIKKIEFIKPLKKLIYVQLRFINFRVGVDLIKSVSKFIEKNINIVELDIFVQDCEIGNQGSIYLSQSLSCLKQLQNLTLFIDHNGMTDNGVFNIIRSLSNNKQLKYLNLDICHDTFNIDDSQQQQYYQQSFNVISKECAKKVIYTLGSQLQLITLFLNIQYYSNEIYINFLKEGYEGLIFDNTEQDKEEIKQFINNFFGTAISTQINY